MGVFSKIFGSGKNSDFILALDIGTEVVKALVFRAVFAVEAVLCAGGVEDEVTVTQRREAA